MSTATTTPTFPNPTIDGQINQAAAMDFADGNSANAKRTCGSVRAPR